MGKKRQDAYNKDMIYAVSGKVIVKSERFVVVETVGLGLKVATSARNIKDAGPIGGEARFFTHLHVREDGVELYGFLSEKELAFFEMLISVSGVGPRSALSILEVANLDELSAAIKEGRPDLLTRASGIGRKTAERVIIELRTKVQSAKSGLTVEKMEGDADIVEALTGLGYRREEARAALAKVDQKLPAMEERLKAALAILSKK
jgi:Holliday junction DNA helicase RuvA